VSHKAAGPVIPSYVEGAAHFQLGRARETGVLSPDPPPEVTDFSGFS